MKVVTIHQPEHLPWLGFFAKMARAELMISLDSVPFRKNYFQNRNRVLGFDGRPLWLTVPVRLDSHLNGRIRDVSIAEDGRWRKKYLRTLEQRYGKHPFFAEVFEMLACIIERKWSLLADLNLSLVTALQDRLGITTPVLRASQLRSSGRRRDLLAGLCREVGAEVYLSGPSGRDYLDLDLFREAGVEVWFHDLEHPTYPQRGTDSFIAHLSVVDLLFNCGEESGGIVRRGSRVSEAVA